MSTTSLKLPDEIKQRAQAAAERLGVSAHAFMVQAIEQAAEAAEQRARFMDEALAARAEALASGQAYAAEDVHDYLRERLNQPGSPRPKARAWRG